MITFKANPVSRSLLFPHKAIFKVSLLMCVYALHLVFFQAAMASSKQDTNKYFKTYLSSKADKKKGKTSPAGFYLQFIKLSNHAERPTVCFHGDAMANLNFPVHIATNEIPPVSESFVYAHLPDDAFKIYRRIRAFLI